MINAIVFFFPNPLNQRCKSAFQGRIDCFDCGDVKRSIYIWLLCYQIHRAYGRHTSVGLTQTHFSSLSPAYIDFVNLQSLKMIPVIADPIHNAGPLHCRISVEIQIVTTHMHGMTFMRFFHLQLL